MRVLVTGAKGQLGYDIVQCLDRQGIDNFGLDFHKLDLTDVSSTRKFFLEFMPDVVIHSAAYTDVDMAESEVEKCRAVNVDVTKEIAILCNELNAKLVYISTDYVFSGDSSEPYEIDSPTGPLSVYGLTKLDGEAEVVGALDKYFIIRTSWAFGINGRNFVKSMLIIGKNKDSINVVCDQVGSPTYTEDLAVLIVDMIKTECYGTYHATNEGHCSRAEFAVEIFRLAGYTTRVNFITSEMYPLKAVRPKYSVLSKEELEKRGFSKLPHWKIALKNYLMKIENMPG